MPILLCMVFLGYTCGSHSVPTKELKTLSDPLASFFFELLQAHIDKRKSRKSRVRGNGRTLSLSLCPTFLRSCVTLHKRYNSVRVLLSDWLPLRPPPLYLTDDYMDILDAVNKTRRRRFAKHKSHRAQDSVCDSESQWVTDKTSAVDIWGRQVTVPGTIKTSSNTFMELRAGKPGPCRMAAVALMTRTGILNATHHRPTC
ncbi:neurotrophin-3-like [Scleropages formosus]|uniref:Neurotrophin-3 n=1 Tax=Scleropages formosus TaxID=113540 RepID=A0A0P7TZU1_SCLFO|nr:neurotrophin-3-like [Scleropages formosus]